MPIVRTLFDNYSFQVETYQSHSGEEVVRLGFGNEYSFQIEDLTALVNFLLLRGEIVLVDSDCQSECPIHGLSTCRPDKSLSCPVSGCLLR